MSTVTVLGFSFELPAPYASGHTCTAAEASALNELLRRGFAKGLYKVIKRELERLGYTDTEFRTEEEAFADARPMAKDRLTENERVNVLELTQTFIERYAVGFAEGQEKVLAIYEEAERIAKGLAETHFNRQGLPAHGAQYEQLTARLAKSERVLAEARRRIEDQIMLAKRAHEEMLEMFGGER